jgi:hypothetical protein
MISLHARLRIRSNLGVVSKVVIFTYFMFERLAPLCIGRLPNLPAYRLCFLSSPTGRTVPVDM